MVNSHEDVTKDLCLQRQNDYVTTVIEESIYIIIDIFTIILEEIPHNCINTEYNIFNLHSIGLDLYSKIPEP